jgi:hypothetical protein
MKSPAERAAIFCPEAAKAAVAAGSKLCAGENCGCCISLQTALCGAISRLKGGAELATTCWSRGCRSEVCGWMFDLPRGMSAL